MKQCADNEVLIYEEDIQHLTKVNLCIIIKKKLKENKYDRQIQNTKTTYYR